MGSKGLTENGQGSEGLFFVSYILGSTGSLERLTFVPHISHVAQGRETPGCQKGSGLTETTKAQKVLTFVLYIFHLFTKD